VPLPDGTFEPLPPIDPQQRYSINEASAYLRQSREKTYRDIREGRLKAITDGRKFISGRELVARAR
jgi:excisionase family DNA binding protein